MDVRLIEARTSPTRYDGVTIAFHWATAILVLALFTSILTADYAPRDWNWHHSLENFHVGLGILFAAVIIGRLAWRIIFGRNLPAADHGIQDAAAKVVHFALYALLLLQMSLGFLTRWFQGEEFSFFGLFSVPPLFPVDHDFGDTLESIHNYVAWIIIFLAAGHAVAALGHHFVTGDGVLRRMLPGRCP